MGESAVPTNKPASKLGRNLLIFLPAVLLFIGMTAMFLWQEYAGLRLTSTSTEMPLNPEIEERFGVRLTGVRVSARNGLVDLRYRVIDAGKAKNFGHYTETSPLIIDEETGKTIEVTIMGLHNHRVEAGRVYYILFRNTGNALHSGSRITIQLDDLTLKNVPVQ